MGDLTNGNNNLVCGDCNHPDPQWAATNRGLVLCNDCAFIHRSLGPQFSRLKALKDPCWNQKLKSMVMTLAAGPANHVWEHLLLDKSKEVKKPGPLDSLETKRKFIMMKHSQFQFVPKTVPEQVEARSQELHSTVRTGAVETTLRLLAGGADPNYFHPEKGTRPMHVAARNGQAVQIELLFLHGAHTAAPDYLGQTPVEHALAAGNKELAQRIVQLRYAVTDQMSHFVCGEVPDHSTSKHIVVPNVKVRNIRQEEEIANLAAYLLEQLAADLYDEVDRRLIERVIHSRFGADSQKFSIAFLPVNPHYPPVRNQARQKFARLTDSELCTLLSVILNECNKRHWNGPSPSDQETERILTTGTQQTEDDDYPLYDSVASDEDLVLAEQQTFLAQQRPQLDETSFVSSKHISNPISPSQLNAYKDNLLITKLMETELQLKDAKELNSKLQKQVDSLQRMLKHCLRENLEILGGCPTGSAIRGVSDTTDEKRSVFSRPSRPSSMCDLSPQEERVNHGRSGKVLGISSIAQTAIQKTIEQIKLLIEHTMQEDEFGIRKTSRDIYGTVTDMIKALVVLKEIKARPEVMDSLTNLSCQALRLCCTVPTLLGPDKEREIVGPVKQLCFDVGAAMKSFASILSEGSA